MGHWSSGKYSTDYEDEDGEEVNQPMPSPEREKEPAKDNGDPPKMMGSLTTMRRRRRRW